MSHGGGIHLGTVVTESELLRAAKVALLEDIAKPCGEAVTQQRGRLIEPEADRETLVAFFTARDPDKLPLIGEILTRFEGKEPTMYEHLVQQYAISRTNPHRDEIIKFYERNNPSRICAADLILDLYTGQEEQLMFLLVNKYIKDSPLRVWCRYVDSSTGREYFHNRITQEVQWETPEGGFLVEPERNVIHPIKAAPRPHPPGVRMPKHTTANTSTTTTHAPERYPSHDRHHTTALSEVPRAPSVPIRREPYYQPSPAPTPQYAPPSDAVFNAPSVQSSSPNRFGAKGGDGSANGSPQSSRRHQERITNHEREEILRSVLPERERALLASRRQEEEIPDYQIPLHPKTPLATQSALGGVPGQGGGGGGGGVSSQYATADSDPCICEVCNLICNGFEELANHKETADHGQWFICQVDNCPFQYPSQLSLLLHRLQVHKVDGAGLTVA